VQIVLIDKKTGRNTEISIWPSCPQEKKIGLWNSADVEEGYIKIHAFLYEQNCRFVIHLCDLLSTTHTTKDPEVE